MERARRRMDTPMFESRSRGTYEFDDRGLYYNDGVGTITVKNGNINAAEYIEIVENFVWPVIARHFPDDNYIYQDDNAPVHRTRIVKKHLEENQNQMHDMARFVQNPDLNIIENVWRKMKIELQKRVHNITTFALWRGQLGTFGLKSLWSSYKMCMNQILNASSRL